ncbi:hypothetical protein [Nesterenkonia haasae]|uniref:hypothetical protein n=1 Tax=Nesterenkonia haasae TaxID=2587813 RepID=UPI001391D2C0|nr:hypothetical protein [Nesterenkonia haasae]NDK32377.1 hypothetical protein [Nesterenkonia haasae]
MNAVGLNRVKFENIREHSGSQHRAWEELAFILTPTLDRLPEESKLVRRGTPDGGIEFHCDAPSGEGVWAWQAKYLFELSKSALDQMTESFESALANLPDLSRYTFILPIDRPAGARGTSAMKKWDKKVGDWTNQAAQKGVTVFFEYHGHSAVLEAIVQPQHVGALRYFFDSTFLTPNSFAHQVERSAKNLGDRYLPTTNVETEFPSVIDALCLTPSFKAQVRDLSAKADLALERLLHALTTRPNGTAPNAAAAARTFAAARVRCEEFLATDDGTALKALGTAAGKGQDAVLADWTNFERTSARKNDRRVPNPHREFDEAHRALLDLGALLSDKALRLSGDASLLVVGAAGIGKSHSLADVAVSRTKVGAPTLLVLGNHLLLNTSLTDELSRFVGLGSWDELIAGMQVAARLSGQGKALIAIDAINEGPGRELWRERLPGLLSELARAPQIGLVLSVRDSYKSSIVSPAAEEALVQHVHRGLAGHESEAVHLYAQEAGLLAPHVPALNPEFSNPLLLRSMCRSAKAQGLMTIPDTSMGEDWIFDGLLKAVNDKISDINEFDLDPADQVVQKGIRALASAMVDAKSETLPRHIAADIGNTILPDGGRESRRLVSVLEREGILLREPRNDAQGEVVRFTYQRMSDHYRTRTFLDGCDDPAGVQTKLLESHEHRGWVDSGLLESLSSMVPVRYGLELLDIVNGDSWVDRAKYTLGQAFFDSLPWRPPATVTERTSALANELIDDEIIEFNDWLSTLLGLACIPDHPLGVRYLHERLVDRSMIERDHVWTLPVQDIWLESESSIARILDWLASNDETLLPQARRDSMLVLSWFLSSNSRRLRDLATKVLVKLTDRTPDGLLHVLQQMESVDDPYIRERLAAVAFGYAARLPFTLRDAQQRDDAVAVHVLAVEMASQADMPSILLTHYMRELTRELTVRLPGLDLRSYQEPECSWPFDPPSRVDLAVRLGDETDHRFLGKSPIGYDFHTYTLERGVVKNFALPNQMNLQRRARRNSHQRRRRALTKIAKAEATTLEYIADLLDEPRDNRSLEEIIASYRAPRTRRSADASEAKQDGAIPAQTEGERLRTKYPAETSRISQAETNLRLPKSIGPSMDVIERWLVNRVLDLGWTPNSPGEKYNHLINRQLEGAEDKIERLGKKYLWIALRELQAGLTQHCEVLVWSSDEPSPYQSVWQLRNSVDIDPTIALFGDRPPLESASSRMRQRLRANELHEAWWLRGFASPLDTEATNGDAWLQSTTDLPLVSRMLAATDPAGDEWVALECHVEWQINNDGPVESFRQDRRDMWFRTQSYLTSTESIQDVRAWSKGKNWMGLWMRTPPDHGEGFYRQYPHTEPWASWFQEIQREHTSGWQGENAPAETQLFRVSDGWYQPTDHEFPAYPQALATFGSNTTSENDMSSKDLSSGVLPSPMLLQILGASHTSAQGFNSEPALKLGGFEREFSWSNAEGIVMFATGGPEWGAPTALYVRASVLHESLERVGLTWWSWVLGEKITWRGGEPTGNRLNVFGAAGLNENGVQAWSFDAHYEDGPD